MIISLGFYGKCISAQERAYHPIKVEAGVTNTGAQTAHHLLAILRVGQPFALMEPEPLTPRMKNPMVGTGILHPGYGEKFFSRRSGMFWLSGYCDQSSDLSKGLTAEYWFFSDNAAPYKVPCTITQEQILEQVNEAEHKNAGLFERPLHWKKFYFCGESVHEYLE